LFGAIGEFEMNENVTGGLFEAEELGLALDADAEGGELIDEEALVLVLREDEREGKGAEACAELAEDGAGDAIAGDPEVDGFDLAAALDDGIGEAELRVELEGAGLDGESSGGGPGFWCLVDDADAYAEPSEPESEYETGWACSGDKDVDPGFGLGSD
jgi:hypothetical protein